VIRLSLLKVDQKKCTKCGMCGEVCPRQIIHVSENGPEVIEKELCIACGHCVAICPNAALDNQRNPLSQQISLERNPILNETDAATFLRSRRSIRSFKKKPVSRETMLELLNIARYAQTGGNSQGLAYLVLENPETIERISSVTMDWMCKQEGLGQYVHYINVYNQTGKDMVLRGAPSVVLALAEEGFRSGWDKACYALTYAELYATTLGLGTCRAGLLEQCAKSEYQPLLEMLRIPTSKKVCGALMVGYPKFSYKRLVERNPLEVFWG
jgi:nitroreductase/Pyruvate/2-oxoacid:ferredoxin oxidoreductase delta subunit